jgi:hypothetical protein
LKRHDEQQEFWLQFELVALLLVAVWVGCTGWLHCFWLPFAVTVKTPAGVWFEVTAKTPAGGLIVVCLQFELVALGGCTAFGCSLRSRSLLVAVCSHGRNATMSSRSDLRSWWNRHDEQQEFWLQFELVALLLVAV